ncbi:MAG: tetratricopeptide repeat protein [Deltaproteobacteria bacterium]|nr:tetratricopeptide repeat protein [Deltaproteobacteria bacterium]
MPQEVGCVEFLRLDVSHIKWDEEILILDIEFSCASGHYASTTAMPFSRENEMVAILFEELLCSCQSLPANSRRGQISFSIRNRHQIALPLRRFLKGYLDAFQRYCVGNLQKDELLLLQANGIDFINASVSLHDKGREERGEILFQRAKSYYYEESFDLAIRQINRALLLVPSLAKAHHLKGLCHRELSHYEDAVRSFLDWKTLVPSTKKEPFFVLGDLYFLLGRFDKGVELFDEYIANFPGDPRGFVGYAQFLYRLRNISFIQYLDQAFQCDPSLLREELRQRWIFEFADSDPQHGLTAHAARTYLNMEKRDFAHMVRKRLVPSHFCEESCRYFFDKEELDQWSDIVNRYEVFDAKFSRNPAALSKVLREQQRKVSKKIFLIPEGSRQEQLSLWGLLEDNDAAPQTKSIIG